MHSLFRLTALASLSLLAACQAVDQAGHGDPDVVPRAQALLREWAPGFAPATLASLISRGLVEA